MNTEGGAKAKLLEEVTKLQEHQTALVDRIKAVVEELRINGSRGIYNFEAGYSFFDMGSIIFTCNFCRPNRRALW